MDIHPVADLFPMMGPQEYEELKNDIKQNGLLEPIVIFKQKVIDGRNRLRACKELGLEPQYKNWNCIGSLVGFVVSKNLHRRHLSESQRALIGAKLKGDYEKDAFERKR
ncbi:MAG: ParB N-terminal domain-containing protein, partial [Crenarchaeota archaeon]|nr:ParB N-terminal domain-containing protein [Thermoproteota archaeon]